LKDKKGEVEKRKNLRVPENYKKETTSKIPAVELADAIKLLGELQVSERTTSQVLQQFTNLSPKK